MFKALTLIVSGMLAGVAVAWFLLGDKEPAVPVIERDLVAAPTISMESAEQHREEGFTNIHTVEEVLALPTQFARGEALYALAGRSDSGEVQNLIQDAARIADPGMRRDSLGVLFMRLTEMDPLSALALARSPAFIGERSLEGNVWKAWGQIDLEAALAAAVNETGQRKNTAAQALFSAHGYVGTPEVERIAAATGIRPDNSNRWQHLISLIETSPRAAADYINSLTRQDERQATTWQLANYLARVDPGAAGTYAALLDDPQARQWFEQAVARSSAQDDPAEVVERLLAGGGMRQRDRQLMYSAMHNLASKDIDKAIELYASAVNKRDKQVLGQVIADALAQDDPARALEWARQNDDSANQQLFQMVLQRLAQHDPGLALAEAQSLQNPAQRSQAINQVIHTMAWRSPEDAIQYISLIENPQQRQSTLVNVLARWVEADFNAAISWLDNNNADFDSDVMVSRLVPQVISQDIDAAIRLADRLDEQQAARVRPMIVQQMVMQESVAAAEGYLRQFEGTPEYDRLKASMISGIAMNDPLEAKRLADELPSGESRDGLMQQLVMTQSETDPQTAAAWIDQIGMEQYRQQAISSLAVNWGHYDPQSAERWADNLPRGTDRNTAIMGMSHAWQELTPSRSQLVQSIGDADTRWQTQVNIISNLAMQDRAAAESAMRRFNLNSQQREQAEQIINNSEGGPGWSLYPSSSSTTRITTTTN